MQQSLVAIKHSKCTHSTTRLADIQEILVDLSSWLEESQATNGCYRNRFPCDVGKYSMNVALHNKTYPSQGPTYSNHILRILSVCDPSHLKLTSDPFHQHISPQNGNINHHQTQNSQSKVPVLECLPGREGVTGYLITTVTVGLRVLWGIYMFLPHQWIVEDVPDSSHLNHNGSIAQEIAQRSQPGGHLKRDRSRDIFSTHRGINDSVSS